MQVLECVANVSTSDAAVVETMCAVVAASGAALLDRHTDADHARSVLTMAAPAAVIAAAAADLAGCCLDLVDITTHAGVHPRLGALDVCPFVPIGFETGVAGLDAALESAGGAAREIAALGIPVFAYDRLSPTAVSLPHVRRDAFGGLAPSWGPPRPHPRAGATAVGVRDVLVALNIDLGGEKAGLQAAHAIAAEVREAGGGPAGLRAIGLELVRQGRVQVSMNLTRPWECGVGTAWNAVAAAAGRHGVDIGSGELVGLVPVRALDDAGADVLDRCAITPERTLEAALVAKGLRDGGAGPLRLPVLA
ncbi:MAG: hypothetical protein U0U69_13265 [Acidimicrobiia bacterium]